jgi:hypothetical protein
MVHQGIPDDIHLLVETAHEPPPTLEPGTKICVRNRFLGDWSKGFEVAEVLGDGYRIRRVSDGLDFPDVFPVADVRLERRNHPERDVDGSYLDREI